MVFHCFSSLVKWSRNVSRIGGPGPIATNIYINILQGHSKKPVVRPYNPSKVSLCRSDYVLISMHSMLMLGGLGARPQEL